MASRPNLFFNNPAFSQAAAGISQMFAPPDGADVAAWEKAREIRDKSNRLTELFDLAKSEGFNQSTFDRMNIAAGQYAPTQSFYAVDTNDATNRYEADARVGALNRSVSQTAAENASKTAAEIAKLNAQTDYERARAAAEQENNARLTALYGGAQTDDQRAALLKLYAPSQSFYAVDQGNQNNLDVQGLRNESDIATARIKADADAAIAAGKNRTDLVGNIYSPLNEGQVRPALPPEIAKQFDLPGIEQAAGTPKPLSRTDVEGQILAGLSQADQRNAVVGDVPIETILDPATNQPKLVNRTDAVGQQPYVKPGDGGKMENGIARLADGRTVPAVQRPDGVWMHAQTGQPLPEDISVSKIGQPVGSPDQFGLTKANQTDVNAKIMANNDLLATATELKMMLQNNPASLGVVGSLRNTAQNVIQTGGEVGQFFGGELANVSRAVRDGLLESNLASEAFDTNLPAIEMLQNLLAWKYAKALAGDRVSNEQLKIARAAIGESGIFTNTASAIARIDRLIQDAQGDLGRLKNAPLETPAAPQAAAPGPQIGTVEDGYRFKGGDPADPANWEPI